MNSVLTVYWHGAGGRYLSVVAESLFRSTSLVDSCSGHSNTSISMLEFMATGETEVDLHLVKTAWDKHLVKNACDESQQSQTPFIAFSQHPDLDLLCQALPDVTFLHITVEPDDAVELAYNWYYKNLNDASRGPADRREEKIQIIQAHQAQYKNFMLSDPVYTLDPAIFDNVSMLNCEFWATITAEFTRKGIRHLATQPKHNFPNRRIFEISWKDLKAGQLKNRLQELADVMGIELQPERKQNALQIIDQWTSNQPQMPAVSLSTFNIRKVD